MGGDKRCVRSSGIIQSHLETQLVAFAAYSRELDILVRNKKPLAESTIYHCQIVEEIASSHNNDDRHDYDDTWLPDHGRTHHAAERNR